MMSTVYVPCIGAHYTNIALAAKFDPAQPSELLYDGTEPDSKIVGLSYLVCHRGGPPPGFAGPNDHWHQHNANGGLCLKGGVVVGGEESTAQECAAMGGRKTLLTDIWMVHAWVVPGIACSWGTFSGECPELGRPPRRHRARRPVPEQVLVARGDAQRSAERRPGRAAEQPALPVVAHFERVVHPGARALHVAGSSRVNRPGQPLGEVDALPQHRPRAGGARRARPGTPRAT